VGALNTFELLCNAYTRESTTFEAVNCSANDASLWGSAIRMFQHFFLSIQFCTVTACGSANSLIFSQNIHSHRIWCLRLVNNSCKSNHVVPGLIFARGAVTFSNSVFQANRCDFFLGTAITDASVTLIGCVVDFSQCNATGAVSVATTQCIVTGDFTVGLCPFRTGTPTISMSPTPGQSPMPVTQKAGKGVAPGVVVAIAMSCAVIGGLAALAAVWFLLVKRANDLRSLPLNSEAGGVPGYYDAPPPG
jgi:hypothetical protein